MGTTTHLFGRARSKPATQDRRRTADPAMGADHLAVVRVNSAWIVHSSLEDDPARPQPRTTRRLAGRR